MFIAYLSSFYLENNQSFSIGTVVNIYICCFGHINNGKFDTVFLKEQNNGKLNKYATQLACTIVNLN